MSSPDTDSGFGGGGRGKPRETGRVPCGTFLFSLPALTIDRQHSSPDLPHGHSVFQNLAPTLSLPTSVVLPVTEGLNIAFGRFYTLTGGIT